MRTHSLGLIMDSPEAGVEFLDWVAALGVSEAAEVTTDAAAVTADSQLNREQASDFIRSMVEASAAFRSETGRSVRVHKLSIGTTRVAAINALFRVSIAVGAFGVAREGSVLLAASLAAPTVADVIASCRRLSTRQLVLLDALVARQHGPGSIALLVDDEALWAALPGCDHAERQALLRSLIRVGVLRETDHNNLEFGRIIS